MVNTVSYHHSALLIRSPATEIIISLNVCWAETSKKILETEIYFPENQSFILPLGFSFLLYPQAYFLWWYFSVNRGEKIVSEAVYWYWRNVSSFNILTLPQIFFLRAVSSQFSGLSLSNFYHCLGKRTSLSSASISHYICFYLFTEYVKPSLFTVPWACIYNDSLSLQVSSAFHLFNRAWKPPGRLYQCFIRLPLSREQTICWIVPKENHYLLIARVDVTYQMSGFHCC